LRLRHLRPEAARFQVFVYGEDGWEDQVDLRDYGNMETRLETCHGMAGPGSLNDPLLDRILTSPHVQAVASPNGALSLRVRGIEFARFKGHTLLYGIHEKRAANPENSGEILRVVTELARFRSADATDRTHPLHTCSPESWIESQVRASLETLDADLLRFPIYGQVPAFAGGERGVIDLLATERTGRLAVLELKATDDPHLPLQALDYWMRVRWHLGRGEFTSEGYFAGLTISPRPPRLLLVAPALEFHSTTETILSFFSPDVPVERLGLGMNWRRQLSVAFRAYGPRRPGMG